MWIFISKVFFFQPKIRTSLMPISYAKANFSLCSGKSLYNTMLNSTIVIRCDKFVTKYRSCQIWHLITIFNFMRVPFGPYTFFFDWLVPNSKKRCITILFLNSRLIVDGTNEMCMSPGWVWGYFCKLIVIHI